MWPVFQALLAANKTVLPLSCDAQRARYDERGLLKLTPTECSPDPECRLALSLKSRPGDLKKIEGGSRLPTY